MTETHVITKGATLHGALMRGTPNIPLLRSDTPGVVNDLHFNNAGAALPPRVAPDAVATHLA